MFSLKESMILLEFTGIFRPMMWELMHINLYFFKLMWEYAFFIPKQVYSNMFSSKMHLLCFYLCTNNGMDFYEYSKFHGRSLAIVTRKPIVSAIGSVFWVRWVVFIIIQINWFLNLFLLFIRILEVHLEEKLQLNLEWFSE